MGRPDSDKLFPTMVIGSLPRPRWVQDVIQDRLLGLIDIEEADRLLDSAVVSAIRLQERAGLDYVSDGEWRRENYVRVFADKVGGFTRNRVQRGRLTLLAYVSDKIESRGTIVCPEAEFLRQNTDRKIVVALPSPCTIGDLMWHPVHSASAYPTRKSFVKACVPILHDEVKALHELGVDAVQLDEPLVPRLANPQAYDFESLSELEEAVELSVETINQVVDGLDDVFLSVHLCHGYGEESVITDGTTGLIMNAARRYQVDRLAMEFNSSSAKKLQSLKDFPKDKLLGLGVMQSKAAEIDVPDTVVQRVRVAMEFVEKERLILNPDCGFATTVTTPGNLDRAYLKLSSLCTGAQMLRNDYV